MGEFKKLREAAAVVNQETLVDKTAALIEFIRQQEFANIAVTGARNIGKTTFINESIGREVWEPGTFAEDEKPLRISFEPLPEDEKFNCLFVSDPSWRPLKSIIYEVRMDTLLSADALSYDIYKLDMVFFLISATAPFGKDDVDALKALAPLKRQVIVNGMHHIKDADRDKILNYISNVNASLELPPVIILESGKNFGKTIRNVIPAYTELKNLRDEKCRDLVKKMFDTLEDAVNNEIETAKTTEQQLIETLSSQNDVLRSGCHTLRNDVGVYKKKAIEKVTKNLPSRRKSLINEILNAAKQMKDSDKIQSAAEEKYKALSNEAIEDLERSFINDLRNVDSAAKLLEVPQWSEDTFEQLKTFSPQNILNQIKLKKLDVKSSSKGSDMKLFISSGLVAGGFTLAPILAPSLAPLPPVVSVGGAVVALGYAIVSHMNNKKSKTQDEFDDVDDAIRQAISNIKDFVNNIANISYNKIIEQILQGEESLKNSTSEKSESRLAELNDILNTLNQMKEKLEI